MKKLILFLLVLIYSTHSYSCDCISFGIKNDFKSADVVVKGRILNKVLVATNDTIFAYNRDGEVELMTIVYDKKAYYNYSIELIDAYKGKIKSKIINIRTEAYTNCAAHLDLSKIYIIYSSIKRRNLYTDLCSVEPKNKAIEEILIKLRKSTHNNRYKSWRNEDH